MKRIETSVVSRSNNGGIDSTRAYNRATEIIDLCSVEYSKAQMYHLCFIEADNQTTEPTAPKSQKQLKKLYSKAITEIARRLKRYRIDHRWLGAFEYDEQNEQGTSKLFHFHVMLICDASEYQPSTIVNRNKSGWLAGLLNRLGVKMYINPPKGYMHLPKVWQEKVDEGVVKIEDIPDSELHPYQTLPKTKPWKIEDAKERVSYLYKKRSKAGVEGNAYTSSRNCKLRTVNRKKRQNTKLESNIQVAEILSRMKDGAVYLSGETETNDVNVSTPIQLFISLISGDVETMSSIELVEFINEIQKYEADYVPLQHDEFMMKVEEILEKDASKFRNAYIHPSNGCVYSCYRFPKREAVLTVMSYSPMIAAQVYDRIEELERMKEQQAPKTFSEALQLAAEGAKIAEEKEIALASVSIPVLKFVPVH